MNQATLHQLKVFEAVVRHGSCSRAAKELFVSQPTVSMQIGQLSKSLGVPLFEKIGKRLCLTDAGRELLETSREIFDSIAQFETKIASLKVLEQGKLRLATITTGKYVIPRTLGRFCQLYPGIDVSLEVTNQNAIVERMASNLDELYVMTQLPEHLDVSYQPFLEDSLVVVASIDHPLATAKNIPIQKIASEPFIMREPGSGTRRAVQKLFIDHKIGVKVKLELGSNEAVKQAIAGGLGISILSRQALNSKFATSELTILDVEHFPLKCNWYIVHLASKQLSAIAQTYLNYLLETAKQFETQTSPRDRHIISDTHLPLSYYNSITTSDQPLSQKELQIGCWADIDRPYPNPKVPV